MTKYLVEAKTLIEGIKDFEIKVIPREENQEVNALRKYAFGVVQEVHYVETGTHSTIKGEESSEE